MDEMDEEFRERALKAAQAAQAAAAAAAASKQQPSSSTSSTQGDKSAVVPYKDFFKSPPVWAVTVAHFCFNWGYYTLLAWLPSYFEMALGLNVQESSFLTLIPYVAMIAMTPVVSGQAAAAVGSSTFPMHTSSGICYAADDCISGPEQCSTHGTRASDCQ